MRISGLNLRKSGKRCARVVFSDVSLNRQRQPLRVPSRAGKVHGEYFDRLSLTPQTEQAARSAQLPVTRMGAGRPGCKQPFIALKGLLKQRGFEEQIQPGGFYFLRG